MKDIIFERHRLEHNSLPFIFHSDTQITSSTGIANWHENPEFLCCTGGEGCVSCDNRDIIMKKGDTVIINSRCLHTVKTNTGVNYHCLIVDKSFFRENGIDIDSLKLCEKTDSVQIFDMVCEFAEHFKGERDEFFIPETRLMLLKFICFICKELSAKSTGITPKPSKSLDAVLDAIEYINNHYSEKLNLDDIAARTGFSKYHFSRIFKENTGLTVVDHLNAIRCERAGRLLCETDLAISQICYDCGFDSPSYFAKAFSKFHGLLPSQYRKNHRTV